MPPKAAKALTVEDDSYVSVCTLKAMLEQQREDLTHQQQDSFKPFVKLKSQIELTRGWTAFWRNDGAVDELQTEEKRVKSKLNEFESAVSSMHEKNKELTTKMFRKSVEEDGWRT